MPVGRGRASSPRRHLLVVRFVIGTNDRVGLDLDHGGIVDQAGDLHHGQGRPDLIEKLAVNLSAVPPLLDIGPEDPGPDHVRGFTSQGLDRGDDELERPAGLSLDVRGKSTIRLDTDGPSDGDQIPCPDRPGIADGQFPR